MKTAFRLLCAASATLAVSGCGAMANLVARIPPSVENTAVASTTLHFATSDIDGHAIPAADVWSAIAANVGANYPPLGRTSADTTLESWEGYTTQLDLTHDQITRTYLNGEFVNPMDPQTREWLHTDVRCTILLSTAPDGDHTDYTLTFPGTVELVPMRDDFGQPIHALVSATAAADDIAKAFADMAGSEISVPLSTVVTGSVDSPYNPDSVVGNFARTLKRYAGALPKEFEIEKDSDFELPYRGATYPVQIQVYPYHNGSRLRYQALVKYTAHADGRLSISPMDIQAVRASIEKIAGE